jgi:hypothetical protein
MGSIGFGTCADGDGTVLDAIVKLLVADPSQCGRDGLESLVARLLRVRGWLDAIEVAIAARAANLADAGEATDAVTVLGGRGRHSRRDAETAAARGLVCQLMPALEAALAGGQITSGHVDAVAAAARTLDDDAKARLAEQATSLVAAASALTPEQFEREAKDLARTLSGDGGLSRQERQRRERKVRRWVDRHGGMHNTLLSLDPLADATVWTAINAAVAAARADNQADDDRSWDQLQADVVVDLLTRRGSDRGERPVPEVSVLLDYDTLRAGLHDASVCETSDGVDLPVETLRRLCCDADVVPIVLGGASEILDVGRSCRVATRAQRRALRALHRTCASPQCTVGFDACRIHHVTYWFAGGASDLDNLLPLCELHHHLVHEGGWTVTLRPGRHTTWRDPEGTVYFDGNSADRRPTSSDVYRQPLRTCERPPPQRRPATATEVADDLLAALATVRYRNDEPAAAARGSGSSIGAGKGGRGPP